MFKAEVYVTLKKSILDPQGQAIKNALHAMTYPQVEDVRMGKYLQVELAAGSAAEAETKVTEMCEKLLANTVIEDYQIKLTEV
jgi:phosphoribosylformylglycinamidine synthase